MIRDSGICFLHLMLESLRNGHGKFQEGLGVINIGKERTYFVEKKREEAGEENSIFFLLSLTTRLSFPNCLTGLSGGY